MLDLSIFISSCANSYPARRSSQVRSPKPIGMKGRAQPTTRPIQFVDLSHDRRFPIAFVSLPVPVQPKPWIRIEQVVFKVFSEPLTDYAASCPPHFGIRGSAAAAEQPDFPYALGPRVSARITSARAHRRSTTQMSCAPCRASSPDLVPRVLSATPIICRRSSGRQWRGSSLRTTRPAPRTSRQLSESLRPAAEHWLSPKGT